jgi:alkanesulfonate monooxygenase SsuD/methylene tetrahydromethanopterin reductase-like flavin-dependent oxidoreductase (luciferase family)
VVAKLVASIDALSNGRVILGVGTGWMPEEFGAVGADFHARGRDADAALAYLRRAFADGEVDGLTVLPTPVQRPGPPIWVGGIAPAALRRAIEYADGWNAPYADPERLAAGIELLHGECRAAGRDPASIDVSVHGIAADDVDDALLDAYTGLGVTDVGVRLPLGNVDAAIDVLAALAERCAVHVLGPDGP